MARTHRSTGAPHVAPAHDDGPFGISVHAVDAFRARVPAAAALAWSHARRELRALARSAVRTDERTGLGDELWVATDGVPFRFVVKSNDRGGRVCVTVLEPREDFSQP